MDHYWLDSRFVGNRQFARFLELSKAQNTLQGLTEVAERYPKL